MLSCKACRRSHYKCDGQFPRCGRCEKAGRECERGRPRQFYHASRISESESFPASQAWLPVHAHTLQFIHLAQGANPPTAGETVPGSTGPHLECGLSTVQAEVDYLETTFDAAGHGFSPPDNGSSETSITCLSPSGSHSREQGSRADPNVHTTTNTVQARAVGRLYLDPPNWPLEDEEDATLLQHFINEVALLVRQTQPAGAMLPTFDFCDKDRHFATVVPQRARTCTALLSAVLSLSARHLSRVGDFDSAVADRHYDKCLKTLIPALDDTSSVCDETLLIIVVILRLLEEFNVPIVGADSQGHLLGARSLTELQKNLGIGSSLRQAAYWACLRQEIYISLRDRRSIRLNLEPFHGFQALQPGNTYSFACAATIHCANTISFAYGYDASHSRSAKYEELVDENRRIHTHKDGQPFYYRARGSDFPDIRYETEDQIIATQYSTLALILLDLYERQVPQTGSAPRRARHIARERVRQHIWTMCGVGLSNTTSPAAILIACMGINQSIECFDARSDMECLAGVLEFTERTRGWPTASIGGLPQWNQERTMVE